MAKTATISEQSMLPVNGKWIWKDDAKCLEFQSNNPNAEKHERKKDKRPKGGILFQDKTRERGATPNIASKYGIGRGRGQGIAGQRSPKPGQKQAQEQTHVTLGHVKSVALGMLSEVEAISPSFEGLYGTDQFDEFLMNLLCFFEAFFKKRAQEMKPNPMNIEPSLREIKHYEDLCAMLEVNQKQLGQAYGIMVLGLGMDKAHHMHCGRSRVSNTYKDRSMYETLYSFCTFVVWIAFKRKEYDIVKKELGRMLRSDTFNPAIRVKHAPDTENAEETKSNKDGEKTEEQKPQEKPMSSAGPRKVQEKRPAIKSIINQRSPALVSILPSPKEEAHWLFKRTRPLSPNSLGTIGKEPEDGTAEGHFYPGTIRMHVGIIGEPIDKYNPQTLTRKAENEDEEQEGDEKKEDGRRGSGGVGTPHGKGQSSGDGHDTRRTTGISQITTEVPSDED